MKDKNKIISYIILVLVCVFLSLNFGHFKELFTQTTTFGSDIGSHYFATEYLKNTLIPNLTILGWDQGSHAGFPIFQFYHPLPFIVIVLLSYLITIKVAFKIFIFLTLFSLPIAFFYAFRILKKSHITSALASILSLLTLYHLEHQIYGGNLASIFSGEFCFAVANSIFVIYIATLYMGVKEKKYILLNGFLLATLPITHLVTFIVALFSASFFLFIKDFKSNFIYLFKTHLLAFLLTAWWTIPMFLKRNFTEDMINVADWWYDLPSIYHIFPKYLIVCYAIILFFIIYSFISKKKKPTLFLFIIYSMFISIVFFIHNIVGWPGRFHPVTGVLSIFGAIVVIDYFIKSKRELITHVFYIFIIIIVLVMNAKVYNLMRGYTGYTFKGMEATSGYTEFMNLHRYIDNNVGNFRIVAQKGEERSKAVTDRSFEYTPYISKALTLEGLYGAGSLGYTFERILDHNFFSSTTVSDTLYKQLIEYNVGWIITVKKESKESLMKDARFTHKYSLDIYDIFIVNQNRNSYVDVIDGPVANLDIGISEWKEEARNWFKGIDDKEYYFTYGKGYKYHDTVTHSSQIDVNRTIQFKDNCIVRENLKKQELLFETKCVGQPHIVKITYFPDWKVEGADQINLVSPGMMLIYPNQSTVRLYYSRDWINVVSNFLTFLSIFYIYF